MRKPTARRLPTIPVARVFFVALEVAFLLARVLPCRADDVLAGRIFSLQGQARVSRDDGQSWSDAVAFQDLYAGDTIRTEPLSRIAILLVDQSMMKIDADTTVKLITVLPSDRIKMGMALTALAKAQQSLYNVLSGRVWLRSDSAFTVETPTVAVGVRGTELAVAVRRDGETVCLA